MIKIESYNPSSKKYVAKYYAKDISDELIARVKFLRAYNNAGGNANIKKNIYDSCSVNGKTKNTLLEKVFYSSHEGRITKDNHSEKAFTASQFKTCVADEEFMEWLESNLTELILAKPQRLIDLEEDLKNNLTGGSNTYSQYKKFIMEICIPYSSLANAKIRRWTNKRLVQEIGAKTCYYCNRQYVITVDLAEDKQRATAQLDHFFPQSKHPILGLSFYNLIPSCGPCNRIKSDAPFELSTHIHPYLEDFGRDGMWYYDGEDVDSILGQDENFEIKMEPRGAKSAKIEGNLNVFVLRELYDQSHRDLVRELIRKKYAFGNAYLSNLIRTFPAAGLTKKKHTSYYIIIIWIPKIFISAPYLS